MRILVIDDQIRGKAEEVRKHAEANHYYPQLGQPPPGDNPAFVARFNTYRAVFSITHHGAETYRHLSVSVPGKKYPNPYAVYTIAELFGFSGWDGKSQDIPKEWAVDLNEKEHCVVVAQRL